MTTEPKTEWVPEMLSAKHAQWREQDEWTCDADDVQSLVTRCADELAKVRAERDAATSGNSVNSMLMHARALAEEIDKVRAELASTTAQLRAVSRDYHNEHSMRISAQEALCSVQDELDEARTRIAELEAAQQWRPLLSEPERCFGWDGHEMEVMTWDRLDESWSVNGSQVFYPIAWLPLPEPPK